MTMSINTGLVSGMDTGAIVTQLLAVEAAPQRALKTKLTTTQTTAGAYRTVNTALQAITSAAETALKPDTWTSTKGTSSAPSVTVTAAAGAKAASLSFTVAQLATTQSTVSTTRWATTTAAANLTTIDVRTADGATSKGTIALQGTESLDQVVDKINTSGLGLVATTVQVSAGQIALEISADKSGKAASFSLAGNETFKATSNGQDAELKIGTASSTTTPYSVTSATNTFEGVLTGATITVSKEETSTPVTVSVVADPDAVTSKVAALMDALTSALNTIKTQTNNAPGSTAALRGEYAVTSIAGQLLEAVSKAVGADGSPARIGLELTRDGKVTFDKTKFTAALKDNPRLAQSLMIGTAADPGVAQRLSAVAKPASDATTGTLTSLAKGQDSVARDIQNRISAWDVRLAKRKDALTRQFTAMETALSSLRNQSNWLSGQLNSLG